MRGRIGSRSQRRAKPAERVTTLRLASVLAGEHGAREKLAVLALVEPRAFEIEEWDAREVREGESVRRELRERLVRLGVHRGCGSRRCGFAGSRCGR